MGGSSSGGWSRLGDVKSLEQKAKAALNEGKRNVFISFATEDMDEVNLLPDRLVDLLLDVSASGINRVERDGVSHQHAARIALVGTMNPEEGQLRPQLLDRFGMYVRLPNVPDVATRKRIVLARMAFDADPQGFCQRHTEQQNALAAQLLQTLSEHMVYPLVYVHHSFLVKRF